MREDLAEVEAALASLQPAPSGVDRDRMMYLAGRASAEKAGPPARRPSAAWLWPCATAASVLVAVAFAALWIARGGQETAEQPGPPPADAVRQPTVDRAVAESSGSPADASWEGWRNDYLELRRLVLADGVDAIQTPPSSARRHPAVPTWHPGNRGLVEQLFDG
jgi:hypothetical protein